MTQTRRNILIGAFLVIAAGLSVFSVTTNAAAPPPVLTVEEAGEEVRSDMTMKDVENATGVPRQYIVTYLHLPSCVAGDKNKPAHEWLSKHGLTIEDLREAVGRYRAGHRF